MRMRPVTTFLALLMWTSKAFSSPIGVQQHGKILVRREMDIFNQPSTVVYTITTIVGEISGTFTPLSGDESRVRPVLTTANIPDQDFDFVNRDPPPKTRATEDAAKSTLLLGTTTSSSSISKPSAVLDGEDEQVIEIVTTMTFTVHPTGRRKKTTTAASPTSTKAATSTTFITSIILTSSASSFLTSTSFPSSAQPSPTIGSGTEGGSGALSGNKDLALKANQGFNSLAAGSSCGGSSMGCISGDLAVCEGGKFKVLQKCPRPLRCFAVPKDISEGITIACLTPSSAAAVIGVDASQLMGGSENNLNNSEKSVPISSALAESNERLSSIILTVQPSQPTTPSQVLTTMTSYAYTTVPTTSVIEKTTSMLRTSIVISTKVATSTTIATATTMVTSTYVALQPSPSKIENGIIGIPV